MKAYPENAKSITGRFGSFSLVLAIHNVMPGMLGALPKNASSKV